MLPAGQTCAPEAFRALLPKRSRAFGLTLSDSSLEKLSHFLAELDIARRRTNLTGPLTAPQLVDHALESVLGDRFLAQGTEVTDIGSGAGFPGIPLAIARPDICLTAVEPRRKRADFLRQVATALALENCFVLEGRAEDLTPGCWQVATARAVGGIERILGEGRFLKEDGLFLAWTTDAQALSRRLAGRFSLEAEQAIPESRKKAIAAFRKRNVPRGTSGGRRDPG